MVLISFTKIWLAIKSFPVSRACLYLLFYIPLLTITILLAFWIYLSSETIPNLVNIDDVKDLEFDYIVIGGGTAGCVLANKLSANEDVSVLLIEAGTTFGPLAMIPLLASQQQMTHVDWQMKTTAQKYSSKGFRNQVQFLPRGKGLGGSSQLNYLLHFDGNIKDFERWQENGANIWNFRDKHETKDNEKSCSFKEKNDDEENSEFTLSEDSVDACVMHKSEKISVAKSHFQTRLFNTPLTYDYSRLSELFVDASKELQRKFQNKLDYYLVKYNTFRGLRYTTYHSYLKPAFGRKNLKILINTLVHRIVFKNKLARSVVVSEDNLRHMPQHIYAKYELILSAGAFHSPQLLQLSGIGPANELQRFGIKVVHNSPLVGSNLYDHLNLPLYVTINDSFTVTWSKVFSLKELTKYVFHGTGILSNFGVIGFINSKDDVHSVGLFGVGSIDERFLKKIANYDKYVFRKHFPYHHNGSQDGFVLLNTCNQPMSRGKIQLNTNHIRNMPLINPNYLQNDADISCIIRSINLATKLMETNQFRSVNAIIQWPEFDECKIFGPSKQPSNEQTDRYLECIIRVGGITAHHPGGTCAIGNKSESVLDGHMKVRGVKNVRVIDASTLPTPVSGTPHTSIVALAEYAADLILNDFY